MVARGFCFSERHGSDREGDAACCETGTTSLPIAICTAAPAACFPRCWTAPESQPVTLTHAVPEAFETTDHPADPAGLCRIAHQSPVARARFRRIAAIAHAHGALFCVDNSTMSPYLQNPLDLGADIVLHSATKFLGGHHDRDRRRNRRQRRRSWPSQIYFVQNAEGNALGPFDCFLLLRGLKTLKLRIDCQQRNAQAVASFLAAHKDVSGVYLSRAPRGARLRTATLPGPGSRCVLSFTTGSIEVSKAIAEQTKLFRITVSFGSVNSSISLPGSMSHASVPSEVMATRDLPRDLVRISAGIEDEEDMIADLDQAISFAKRRALVPVHGVEATE